MSLFVKYLKVLLLNESSDANYTQYLPNLTHKDFNLHVFKMQGTSACAYLAVEVRVISTLLVGDRGHLESTSTSLTAFGHSHNLLLAITPSLGANTVLLSNLSTLFKFFGSVSGHNKLDGAFKIRRQGITLPAATFSRTKCKLQ